MEDPVVRTILEKYLALEPLLDERAKRIWAGTEVCALGREGAARVMEATGMSGTRVAAGVKGIESSGVGGVRARPITYKDSRIRSASTERTSGSVSRSVTISGVAARATTGSAS